MRPGRTLLAAAVLVFAVQPRPAGADDTWTDLTPSVRYLHRTTTEPWSIHVLFIDPCDPAVSFRATRPDERGQVVSSFAASVEALAAINGDFFSFASYGTSGLAVGQGQRWTDTADNASEGFVAFGDENRWILSVPSAVVEPPEEWMREVVSGRPLIVSGGEKIEPTEPSHMFSRNPRTALGWDEDGHLLIWMVVDGRQPSLSVGMTWEEMADTMIGLGAEEVLNLDGGGSSTMWIEGLDVVNAPSDGTERVVANHLALRWQDLEPSLPSLCCFPSAVPEADGPFQDLAPDHPARVWADALWEAGLSDGCSADPRLFCPDCRASRAEAVVLVLMASGESPSAAGEPTFQDVPPDHWAFGWIERAAETGLTSGCSTDPPLFCPERAIRRSELAIVVQRQSAVPPAFPSLPTFPDVPAPHMAFGSVEGLTADCLDVACPVDPERFCPDRPATRAELASFTVQAFDVGNAYGCPEPEGDEPFRPDEDAATDAPADIPDFDGDFDEAGPDSGDGDPGAGMDGGCACALAPV